MDYTLINKKNLPKWEEALKFIIKILSENGIPYYLSASGLDYIKNKSVYPYDIDLFMSEENVRKVYEILKEYTNSDLHKWEDKYLEFQGEYNGIPFEICEWEEEPNRIIQKGFKVFEVSIVE